jgi:hypothetical protein
MFRLFSLGTSTTALAIVLSRLYSSSNDFSFCWMGIDTDNVTGGKSCIVGIATASLSSLLAIALLAVDIASRDGLLSQSRVLGSVDYILSCITCLLWLAETIYASRDLSVTVSTFHYLANDGHYLCYYVGELPTNIHVAGVFFCIISGMSMLIWGVIVYLSFATVRSAHRYGLVEIEDRTRIES